MRRWMVVVCAADCSRRAAPFDGTLPGQSRPRNLWRGHASAEPEPGTDNADGRRRRPSSGSTGSRASFAALGATSRLREDVEPGDADQQLVDRLGRCQPYEFSMFGVSFAHLVPSVSLFGRSGPY